MSNRTASSVAAIASRVGSTKSPTRGAPPGERADKLAARVRLLDVYNGIDCEFYFEPGHAYLFFAIVAKSSRYVYYQPEVCNWTRALRSTRVASPHGAIWLEDLIAEDYGPGEPPRGEDPWKGQSGGNSGVGE